jgi:TetR/AcrR family transcriptional regulator, transcriptional repressor for nem operon
MDQKPDSTHTSHQILDIAQRLVQTRGFNAFSYADIASALAMTKASLHYHFASKERLGVSLIERYQGKFTQLLGGIDSAGSDAADKLRRYVAIYAGVLADNRMCLCGMLAAEFETLPGTMQTALEAFFALNESWLAGVLEGGRAAGTLAFDGSATEAAQYIIASLEGAMMLARPDGNPQRFEAASRRMLAGFGI